MSFRRTPGTRSTAIEQELHRKLGCEAVIHMDPIADDDGATAAVRAQVEELVNCIDPVMTLHDFRMVPGPTHTNLIFDVAAPFGFRLSDQEIVRQICALVQSLDSRYNAVVHVDHTYS